MFRRTTSMCCWYYSVGEKFGLFHVELEAETMNDRLNYITSLLSTIPEKPGCYQYYDAKGTVIYVGKAKNLRKRISSYFQRSTRIGRHAS